MAKKGYIALYRKIQDNKLWKKKRVFSEAEAWIDILMEAQHSEQQQEVLLGMAVIECGYAQSLNSIKTWAKRWGWSMSRVTRFFKLLKNENMIETENVKKTTRLTVCNYSRYDPKRIASELQSNRERNASEKQSVTDNNVNNVNNEKNENKKRSSSFSGSGYKTAYELECEKAFEIAQERFLRGHDEEE